MEKLDNKLKEHIGIDPTGLHPVIVICQPECSDLFALLQSMDVRVAEPIPELNMVATDLTVKLIYLLSQRDDVVRIELDEDVSIE